MLRNLTTYLCIGMSVFTISACTGSGGGNSNPETPVNVPENIVVKPIYDGVALTDAEKQQIRSIQQQSAIMPSPQLALISPEETAGEKQERERQIANLSTTSKNIYNDIVTNCQIQHPQITTEGPQGPLVAGDTIIKTQKAAIYGAGCSIDYKNNLNTKIFIDEMSSSGNTVLYAVRGLSDVSYDLGINSTSLQNQVGFVKQTITAKVQVAQNNKGGSYNRYQKWVGQLNITLANGSQIPMSIYNEILSKDSNKNINTQDTFQVYMEVSFLLGATKAVGQIYMKDGQIKPYINGVASNLQEFSEIFGPVETLIPRQLPRVTTNVATDF